VGGRPPSPPSPFDPSTGSGQALSQSWERGAGATSFCAFRTLRTRIRFPPFRSGEPQFLAKSVPSRKRAVLERTSSWAERGEVRSVDLSPFAYSYHLPGPRRAVQLEELVRPIVATPFVVGCGLAVGRWQTGDERWSAARICLPCTTSREGHFVISIGGIFSVYEFERLFVFVGGGTTAKAQRPRRDGERTGLRVECCVLREREAVSHQQSALSPEGARPQRRRGRGGGEGGLYRSSMGVSGSRRPTTGNRQPFRL